MVCITVFESFKYLTSRILSSELVYPQLQMLASMWVYVCVCVCQLRVRIGSDSAFSPTSSMFLTLDLLHVYLLTGMLTYVSPNLSKSTSPSVTRATGQHTHTRMSTLTHTQTVAFLVSHAVYSHTHNFAKIKNITLCVHIANLYDLHTHALTHTHIHTCYDFTPCLSSLCPGACAFMSNNLPFTATHQR